MSKLGTVLLVLPLVVAACGTGQRNSTDSGETGNPAEGTQTTDSVTTSPGSGTTGELTGPAQTTDPTATGVSPGTTGTQASTDTGTDTSETTDTSSSGPTNTSTSEADNTAETDGDDGGCLDPCYLDGVFIQCCTADETCREGKCLPHCPTQIRCGADGLLCCSDGELCSDRVACMALTTPCETEEDCEPEEYCELAVGQCAPRPSSDCLESSPPVSSTSNLRARQAKRADLVVHAELDHSPCEFLPSSIDLVIRVENRGPIGAPSGVAVDLFSLEVSPKHPIQHIAELRTPGPLLPGESTTLVHRISAPQGKLLPNIHIVVDGPAPQDSQIDECDESNNDIELDNIYCITPR